MSIEIGECLYDGRGRSLRRHDVDEGWSSGNENPHGIPKKFEWMERCASTITSESDGSDGSTDGP